MNATAEVVVPLRSVPLLAGLSDEQLGWIASQCRIVDLLDDGILARPADLILPRDTRQHRPQPGVGRKVREKTVACPGAKLLAVDHREIDSLA